MSNIKDYNEPLITPEMSNEDLTFDMDTNKYLNDVNIKFHFLEKCVKNLKLKIERQKNIPTTVDAIAKVHMFLGSLDKTCEEAEVAIATLDKMGEWKLTEEDIARINAEDNSKKIFKTFLPQMIAYHLSTTSNQSNNGHKGYCTTL